MTGRFAFKYGQLVHNCLEVESWARIHEKYLDKVTLDLSKEKTSPNSLVTVVSVNLIGQVVWKILVYTLDCL